VEDGGKRLRKGLKKKSIGSRKNEENAVKGIKKFSSRRKKTNGRLKQGGGKGKKGAMRL